MTKIWYNIDTGSGAVFDDDEDMANWPDFQENQPESALPAESSEDKRNGILAATDWWGADGHVMTAAQTQYRKDLLALPNHVNWPNLSDDDWPIFPGV